MNTKVLKFILKYAVYSFAGYRLGGIIIP